MSRKDKIVLEIVSIITVVTMVTFMISIVGLFLGRLCGASYDIICALQIAVTISAIVGVIVAFIAQHKDIPLSTDK